MSLEEKLEKIKSPNLENQKHTSVVLTSIEDTLREQNTKFTPTAYFAALLALLKQTSSGTNGNEANELTVSAVYLLDLITSHVPPTLLRTQFSSIVSLLAPYLNVENTNTQLLKSAIGCLESILVAQDGSAWNLPSTQTSPRQALTALLPLAIDQRPKLRKRAQDAIKTVLQNPPPGPAIDHPAAELCAIAAQNNLKSAVQIVHQNRKQRNKNDDGNDPPIIHALQLTKTVAVASGGWPSKKIESLCEILLSISRSRNDFLVMSAFEVFEVIFDGMQDELSSAKLPRILEAITELKPAQNDAQLLPSWIAILSRGYGAYAAVDPEEVFSKLPELMDLITNFLPNSAHNIRVSASECLISFFANCIPGSVILEPSVYDEKLLQQIADKALELLSVKYQTAWMEVFSILSALFDAFRWRGDPYLLAISQTIGELRGNSGFQGKKEADEVLGHAIRNLGPQAVLNVLPLNLIKPKAGQSGRAWLLPLLRDNVTNTSLGHFKSELVPLSEAMYQRVMDHGSAEKTMEVKVYETVVQQVWSILPGYCDLPVDLQVAVDQKFAELLSNVLYQQADLRVVVCRALQNLVESNQAIVASDAEPEELQIEHRTTKDDAQGNIAHLATLAGNLLAVLFNVYSQTLPQSRAYILQCINAYLSVTPEKDLIDTFERVAKMLEGELPAPDAPPPRKQPDQQSRNKMPPTSHTLLDLVIALSVHLPRSAFAALFALASNIITNPAILISDPQLIKKAYKLIPRLATSDKGKKALKTRSSELQQLIIATNEKTPVPARRDRTLAIDTIISFLSDSDLHFIPSILSEIVLSCKDANEKARTAGFQTLFSAAKKISDAPPGTKIRNSLVSHMPDDAADAPATTEEVFTMVSAGLAGVAPHMVAASITALGALLYEYHNSDSLSGTVKEELVDTVTMFIQSNNREIVRATLGFVKVIVVILPLEALEPRMAALVPALLVWSKENKGRLKAKVKNILDRLVRRFGGAQVEEWAGPDAKKLIVNIRKARERARRKKQGTDEVDSDDEAEQTEKGGKSTYDNEFDEAVYGSDDDDSEMEFGSDNDDAMSGVTLKSKTTNKSGKTNRTKDGRDQYIRAQEDSDDEPLDLLDPKSISAISSSRHSSSKLGGAQQKRRTKARYNEDGKLVLGGADSDDGDDAMLDTSHGTSGEDGKPNNAVDAYLDAVSGPHAVQRGQKGRLKVKSGMQKASRQEVQKQDRAGGDKMDLDLEEAREIARKIMSGAPASPKMPVGVQKSANQRRSLGGEKVKGGGGGGGGGGSSSEVERRRNKPGPGKRGVRFSSHPARKGQGKRR
ncbi:pre-rRNA processing protein [Neophaeococcomyces mojaviensis]|uniref:Pre-rRNA processing protein n=1 Tax=Neophaeococcomyces mojaviensis TaxID=3383035 RepID=A0ACC2ZWD5_9EURO|nr:pre-rRNA processing protein [Knufia sp. JES_112]